MQSSSNQNKCLKHLQLYICGAYSCVYFKDNTFTCIQYICLNVYFMHVRNSNKDIFSIWICIWKMTQRHSNIYLKLTAFIYTVYLLIHNHNSFRLTYFKRLKKLKWEHKSHTSKKFWVELFIVQSFKRLWKFSKI